MEEQKALKEIVGLKMGLSLEDGVELIVVYLEEETSVKHSIPLTYKALKEMVKLITRIVEQNPKLLE